MAHIYRDEESGSESEESSQDEASEEESSDDDDDDEPVPAVKSYTALMQSFTRDSAPQAKRRKLNVDKEEKEDEDANLMDEDTNDADLVEEEEEGPETATEGVLEEDDEEDKADPFEAHFANPDDNILSRRLQHLEKGQWALRMSSLAKVGTAITSIPGDGEPRAMKAVTISNPDGLKLKQKLANVIKKQRPTFDALEKSIAPLVFGYQDLLFTERNTSNAESLRRLTCLHAVNHVFK